MLLHLDQDIVELLVVEPRSIILLNDRIERVPELMGNSGIDQPQELVVLLQIREKD